MLINIHQDVTWHSTRVAHSKGVLRIKAAKQIGSRNTLPHEIAYSIRHVALRSCTKFTNPKGNKPRCSLTPNYSLLMVSNASDIISLTYINDTVVGEFPTALQPEYAKGIALFGAEVSQGGVCHVIRLQRELVEGRKQLGNGADGFVSYVDAVC